MPDSIIYGEPLGPRVASVLPLEDYKLLLSFTNGEKRIFDAKPLLSLKPFKPLQSNQLFKAVKLAYGSVLWPNDIDYCPDTLYAESVPADDAAITDDILTEEDIADIEQARAEFARGETVRHEDINWN